MLEDDRRQAAGETGGEPPHCERYPAPGLRSVLRTPLTLSTDRGRILWPGSSALPASGAVALDICRPSRHRSTVTGPVLRRDCEPRRGNSWVEARVNPSSMGR
jgi:hypothetical protein